MHVVGRVAIAGSRDTIAHAEGHRAPLGVRGDTGCGRGVMVVERACPVQDEPALLPRAMLVAFEQQALMTRLAEEGGGGEGGGGG